MHRYIFAGLMARTKNKKTGTSRQIILEAAAKLFYLKGYAASSMRELAEEVGVEASSLYNHIRSKSSILEHICANIADTFTAHLDIIEKSEQTSIAQVESLLRFQIRQRIYDHEQIYTSDREWKHLPEPYLFTYQEQRRSYRKRMSLIIEHGISRGEIRAMDAPTAVLTILHAIAGIETWHRSNTRISAELLEDNMVMILTGGLKK